jgi:hypothetical protein
MHLEAWTGDDPWVQAWYRSQGFEAVGSYLHVFIEGRDELRDAIQAETPDSELSSLLPTTWGTRMRCAGSSGECISVFSTNCGSDWKRDDRAL